MCLSLLVCIDRDSLARRDILEAPNKPTRGSFSTKSSTLTSILERDLGE